MKSPGEGEENMSLQVPPRTCLLHGSSVGIISDPHHHHPHTHTTDFQGYSISLGTIEVDQTGFKGSREKIFGDRRGLKGVRLKNDFGNWLIPRPIRSKWQQNLEACYHPHCPFLAMQYSSALHIIISLFTAMLFFRTILNVFKFRKKV